jgi:hypothetical protein
MNLRFEIPAARLLLVMAAAGAGLLPAATAAADGSIDIVAIGVPSTEAEDANGQPEDGCQLRFEVSNRGPVALSAFMSSFAVMKASTGAPLQAHFPIALTKLGPGQQQRTPPDLIHGATCADLKVQIKGQTCMSGPLIECPSIGLSARGLAGIERRKRK